MFSPYNMVYDLLIWIPLLSLVGYFLLLPFLLCFTTGGVWLTGGLGASLSQAAVAVPPRGTERMPFVCMYAKTHVGF